MGKRKCGCVIATAENTESVRSGHELGGYVKHFCDEHTPTPTAALSSAGEKEIGHVLYKTGDMDAPDVIKGRNGEVVLDLCRVCNKGETELSHPCSPHPASADKLEVVARLDRWRNETANQWSDEYEPRENWERQVSGAMREWGKATDDATRIITACQQEVERLTRERDEALDMLAISTDGGLDALLKLWAAEARNAVLEKALDPFADLANSVFRIDDGREMNACRADNDAVWGFDRVEITYGDLRRAREALGGQSNE